MGLDYAVECNWCRRLLLPRGLPRRAINTFSPLKNSEFSLSVFVLIALLVSRCGLGIVICYPF